MFHTHSVIFIKIEYVHFTDSRPHSSLFKCQDKYVYYHKYMDQQVKCYSNRAIQLSFNGPFLELNDPYDL